MNDISSDEIIRNIKQVSDKYQEVLLYLMQGKGNIIPPSLVDVDKSRMILSSVSEQLVSNPEKFLQLNIEYVDIGKFFEKNAFAFHHWLGRKRANISQSKHCGSIG